MTKPCDPRHGHGLTNSPSAPRQIRHSSAATPPAVPDILGKKGTQGLQAGKHPGPEASILKLVGTELLQDIEELCMELIGENALNWFNAAGVVPGAEETIGSWFCYHRAATILPLIYVPAQQKLGLPRSSAFAPPNLRFHSRWCAEEALWYLCALDCQRKTKGDRA